MVSFSESADLKPPNYYCNKDKSDDIITADEDDICAFYTGKVTSGRRRLTTLSSGRIANFSY
jgi:hypothetical protein